MFKDRRSAGKLLAKRLKNIKADLVLAIPRGGVVVGKEIAAELNLPLDIIVTRKIGAPMQPELALGAIDPDGVVVWDNLLLEEMEFKIENLRFKIDEEMEEIKRREKIYRQGRQATGLKNKTVILVDDGIATGSTMLAAVNYLKRHNAKRVILAIPVAGYGSARKLTKKVDEVVILETPQDFQAVGQFYQEFLPVTDQEVIEYLNYGR